MVKFKALQSTRVTEFKYSKPQNDALGKRYKIHLFKNNHRPNGY